MALFDRALLTAVIQHTNVSDKRGEPYIYHPIRVAEYARFCGLDEYCQATGVLHDVVEDTNISLPEIYRQFGQRVGDGLDSLTRRNKKNARRRFSCTQPTANDHYMCPSYLYDESYFEFVKRAVLNRDAAKLKMLDNADNMRPERRIKGLKLEGRYQKSLQMCREAVISYGDIDFLERFDSLVDWM